MDTESVTTAKPYIDHSNLKAHILFLTKVFHTTSLKFSELNSGTYSLDSYTSPDETLNLRFVVWKTLFKK